MSVVSVKARSFILALFIRDDGERFLLGDNGYDFKDSQLHFVANTIENDEVVKQGADGVMLAGQVRRSAVQSFDGYVGDATMAKETIEQMRRDFFAFFVKGHHFRVIYIDCNRNAWQRKGGYLVDAPEVKELWQIHPEYHVGLNFEDVNYYSYDEDADGNEILANLLDIPVSTAVAGGLVWDEDGAVSEDAVVDHDAESAGAQGKSVYINDAAEAPLSAFKLDGETSQNGTPTPDAPIPVQTVTGENVVKISDGQGNEQSYEVNLGNIELCKIGTYQDYIYKSGSDWKIHKAVGKYQLDGTINWYANGTNNYQCTRSGDNKLYLATSATGLSNYFNVSNSSTGINMYPITQTGTDYIRITNAVSEWASTDLFKTFLTNNAVYLYYPLAESAQTDTTITNEALITQLEAVLGGHTYAGINNIFTITPNEQGTLEVGYYTKYQPIVTGGGYVWEAGGAGGATIVVNNSIDNVNPIWKIYGPTMNPQLENSTTGEVIEYVGLIAEGQTLTIDMGEQTASLDGLNVISNMVGDFVSLAPGANRLIYSVSGDAGASEIGWSEIVG